MTRISRRTRSLSLERLESRLLLAAVVPGDTARIYGGDSLVFVQGEDGLPGTSLGDVIIARYEGAGSAQFFDAVGRDYLSNGSVIGDIRIEGAGPDSNLIIQVGEFATDFDTDDAAAPLDDAPDLDTDAQSISIPDPGASFNTGRAIVSGSGDTRDWYTFSADEGEQIVIHSTGPAVNLYYTTDDTATPLVRTALALATNGGEVTATIGDLNGDDTLDTAITFYIEVPDPGMESYGLIVDRVEYDFLDQVAATVDFPGTVTAANTLTWSTASQTGLGVPTPELVLSGAASGAPLIDAPNTAAQALHVTVPSGVGLQYRTGRAIISASGDSGADWFKFSAEEAEQILVSPFSSIGAALDVDIYVQYAGGAINEATPDGTGSYTIGDDNSNSALDDVTVYLRVTGAGGATYGLVVDRIEQTVGDWDGDGIRENLTVAEDLPDAWDSAMEVSFDALLQTGLGLSTPIITLTGEGAHLTDVPDTIDEASAITVQASEYEWNTGRAVVAAPGVSFPDWFAVGGADSGDEAERICVTSMYDNGTPGPDVDLWIDYGVGPIEFSWDTQTIGTHSRTFTFEAGDLNGNSVLDDIGIFLEANGATTRPYTLVVDRAELDMDFDGDGILENVAALEDFPDDYADAIDLTWEPLLQTGVGALAGPALLTGQGPSLTSLLSDQPDDALATDPDGPARDIAVPAAIAGTNTGMRVVAGSGEDEDWYVFAGEEAELIRVTSFRPDGTAGPGVEVLAALDTLATPADYGVTTIQTGNVYDYLAGDLVPAVTGVNAMYYYVHVSDPGGMPYALTVERIEQTMDFDGDGTMENTAAAEDWPDAVTDAADILWDPTGQTGLAPEGMQITLTGTGALPLLPDDPADEAGSAVELAGLNGPAPTDWTTQRVVVSSPGLTEDWFTFTAKEGDSVVVSGGESAEIWIDRGDGAGVVPTGATNGYVLGDEDGDAMLLSDVDIYLRVAAPAVPYTLLVDRVHDPDATSATEDFSASWFTATDLSYDPATGTGIGPATSTDVTLTGFGAQPDKFMVTVQPNEILYVDDIVNMATLSLWALPADTWEPVDLADVLSGGVWENTTGSVQRIGMLVRGSGGQWRFTVGIDAPASEQINHDFFAVTIPAGGTLNTSTLSPYILQANLLNSIGTPIEVTDPLDDTATIPVDLVSMLSFTNDTGTSVNYFIDIANNADPLFGQEWSFDLDVTPDANGYDYFLVTVKGGETLNVPAWADGGVNAIRLIENTTGDDVLVPDPLEPTTDIQADLLYTGAYVNTTSTDEEIVLEVASDADWTFDLSIDGQAENHDFLRLTMPPNTTLRGSAFSNVAGVVLLDDTGSTLTATLDPTTPSYTNTTATAKDVILDVSNTGDWSFNIWMGADDVFKFSLPGYATLDVSHLHGVDTLELLDPTTGDLIWDLKTSQSVFNGSDTATSLALAVGSNADWDFKIDMTAAPLGDITFTHGSAVVTHDPDQPDWIYDWGWTGSEPHTLNDTAAPSGSGRAAVLGNITFDENCTGFGTLAVDGMVSGTIGVISGLEVASATSDRPAEGRQSAISADGRYVAYVGFDPEYDPTTDPIEYPDTWLRDTKLGTSTPMLGGTNVTGNPDISDNGQFVVFEIQAQGIARVDLGTSTLSFVNVDATGALGTQTAFNPAISGDGRYTVFETSAALTPDDTDTYSDIYRYDSALDAIQRVSAPAIGTANNGASTNPVISYDGRFIAYQSDASGLVLPDTNGNTDVFLRDMQTGQTTIISVSTVGVQALNASTAPSISSDGRFVAYASEASNLVGGDTNSARDVFVRDTLLGSTVRASVSDGVQGDGDSYDPAISGDGSTVVFASVAANFADAVETDQSEVYRAVVATGALERISQVTDYMTADGDSRRPVISADGSTVYFETDASNLAPALHAVGDRSAIVGTTTAGTLQTGETIHEIIVGFMPPASSGALGSRAGGVEIAGNVDRLIVRTSVSEDADARDLATVHIGGYLMEFQAGGALQANLIVEGILRGDEPDFVSDYDLVGASTLMGYSRGDLSEIFTGADSLARTNGDRASAFFAASPTGDFTIKGSIIHGRNPVTNLPDGDTNDDQDWYEFVPGLGSAVTIEMDVDTERFAGNVGPQYSWVYTPSGRVVAVLLEDTPVSFIADEPGSYYIMVGVDTDHMTDYTDGVVGGTPTTPWVYQPYEISVSGTRPVQVGAIISDSDTVTPGSGSGLGHASDDAVFRFGLWRDNPDFDAQIAADPLAPVFAVEPVLDEHGDPVSVVDVGFIGTRGSGVFGDVNIHATGNVSTLSGDAMGTDTDGELRVQILGNLTSIISRSTGMEWRRFEIGREGHGGNVTEIVSPADLGDSTDGGIGIVWGSVGSMRVDGDFLTDLQIHGAGIDQIYIDGDFGKDDANFSHVGVSTGPGGDVGFVWISGDIYHSSQFPLAPSALVEPIELEDESFDFIDDGGTYFSIVGAKVYHSSDAPPPPPTPDPEPDPDPVTTTTGDTASSVAATTDDDDEPEVEVELRYLPIGRIGGQAIGAALVGIVSTDSLIISVEGGGTADIGYIEFGRTDVSQLVVEGDHGGIDIFRVNATTDVGVIANYSAHGDIVSIDADSVGAVYAAGHLGLTESRTGGLMRLVNPTDLAPPTIDGVTETDNTYFQGLVFSADVQSIVADGSIADLYCSGIIHSLVADANGVPDGEAFTYRGTRRNAGEWDGLVGVIYASGGTWDHDDNTDTDGYERGIGYLDLGDGLLGGATASGSATHFAQQAIGDLPVGGVFSDGPIWEIEATDAFIAGPIVTTDSILELNFVRSELNGAVILANATSLEEWAPWLGNHEVDESDAPDPDVLITPGWLYEMNISGAGSAIRNSWISAGYIDEITVGPGSEGIIDSVIYARGEDGGDAGIGKINIYSGGIDGTNNPPYVFFENMPTIVSAKGIDAINLYGLNVDMVNVGVDAVGAIGSISIQGDMINTDVTTQRDINAIRVLGDIVFTETPNPAYDPLTNSHVPALLDDGDMSITAPLGLSSFWAGSISGTTGELNLGVASLNSLYVTRDVDVAAGVYVGGGIGYGWIGGDLNGSLDVRGANGTLANLMVGGGVSGNVTSAGSIGALTILRGDLNGYVEAAGSAVNGQAIGRIGIYGGDLNGVHDAELGRSVALRTSDGLGNRPGGGIGSVYVGGNLTGDIIATSSAAGWAPVRADIGSLVVTGGDLDGRVVIERADPTNPLDPGGSLGSLGVYRGDLTGGVSVAGDLRCAVILGDVTGRLDVEGDLGLALVVGDVKGAGIDVGGKASTVFVLGDFVDSNLTAERLGYVLLLGDVSSSTGTDVIHAMLDEYRVLAGGVSYSIYDPVGVWFDGIHAFLG